jgi:dTDP-4-amino-4,6-dideoxygalactose transaminase
MTTTTSIPMVDLRAQYLRIQADVDAALARVVSSTQFIGGEECRLFEQEFAAYCGAAHAVGVANGTDALAIALRAYGVGPGDEVVTVANTFIATGEAILLNGARPVFVDVDEASFTMDPRQLERAVTKRTKVILPVHLYGHPANMPEILAVAARHGLPVLEDAAQAHGAEVGGRRAGSLGHAACFSFYPGKNLGAYGDAGMVTTNDADFAARVRQIANHGGGATKYDNVVVGTNSRLDALQAAVLRVKLRELPRWTAERLERALAYSKLLGGVPGLVLPREQPWGRSAWHLYTLRASDREGLQAHLQARGIATAVHYPRPIHLQPAMAAAGGRAGDLPVSERLSREVLQVPLYPELPLEELERVAGEISTFCEGRRSGRPRRPTPPPPRR